jgi:hypothetical protein
MNVLYILINIHIHFFRLILPSLSQGTQTWELRSIIYLGMLAHLVPIHSFPQPFFPGMTWMGWQSPNTTRATAIIFFSLRGERKHPQSRHWSRTCCLFRFIIPATSAFAKTTQWCYLLISLILHQLFDPNFQLCNVPSLELLQHATQETTVWGWWLLGLSIKMPNLYHLIVYYISSHCKLHGDLLAAALEIDDGS